LIRARLKFAILSARFAVVATRLTGLARIEWFLLPRLARLKRFLVAALALRAE
jgi:hypothetical protein